VPVGVGITGAIAEWRLSGLVVSAASGVVSEGIDDEPPHAARRANARLRMRRTRAP
jgi:hypothetical protein